MSTTPAQIDIWRCAATENQRLEFKEAKTQLDNRKLYKYCVALANEGGGHLVLGVADKPPRPVVGTTAFNDPDGMAEKLFAAVGFRVDIEEVVHPDGRVLVFHIPSRPRGTAYHLGGSYLMRSVGRLVPVERFIDGYQSRNERLADLMRRFSICEEKSSGIDKVIHAVEVYQLPPPDFRSAFRRTAVTVFGHKPIEDMDRDSRIRACYQHCCLRYVLHQKMTNQTLRERFKLPKTKVALVSQTLAMTVDAGIIKPSDPDKSSTRYRSYIPIWA
jgi:predicted HTH transcriptional regulator